MYRHLLFFCGSLLFTSCSHDIGPLAVKANLHTTKTVSTIRLTPQTISETVEAVGTVKSTHPTILAAQTVSTVTSVRVSAGDFVRKGQALITLDDREHQTQLQKAMAAHHQSQQSLIEVESAILAAHRAQDAATARHELAQATATRYSTLFTRGSIAPQEYDAVVAQHKTAAAEVEQAAAQISVLQAKRYQARANIQQSEAELRQAKIALSHSTITAPQDGFITEKTAEIGSVTTPGAPLLTFESDDYVLEALLRESDLNSIHVGQQGMVTLDALGKQFVSTIGEILPANNPLSQTFIVKVPLTTTPGLRSGLYGKAHFIVGQRSGIVVPTSAIIERGQLQSVFIVDNHNIAAMRLVTTGKPTPQGIELLTGVDAGERLVTQGVETLADGMSVIEGAAR